MKVSGTNAARRTLLGDRLLDLRSSVVGDGDEFVTSNGSVIRHIALSDPPRKFTHAYAEALICDGTVFTVCLDREALNAARLLSADQRLWNKYYGEASLALVTSCVLDKVLDHFGIEVLA